MATAAAARWAAASGVDVMALGRNPAVAATLEAGIRAEALRPSACAPTSPAAGDRRRSTTTTAAPGRPIVFLNGWTASGLVWPAELDRPPSSATTG